MTSEAKRMAAIADGFERLIKTEGQPTHLPRNEGDELYGINCHSEGYYKDEPPPPAGRIAAPKSRPGLD